MLLVWTWHRVLRLTAGQVLRDDTGGLSRQGSKGSELFVQGSSRMMRYVDAAAAVWPCLTASLASTWTVSPVSLDWNGRM